MKEGIRKHLVKKSKWRALIKQACASCLEDTGLVRSVLPKNVKPAPLGKDELVLWKEKFGRSV
jgi:hypothetical protein